jgi:phage terminase small subunit
MTEAEVFGPKMAALTEKQRRFVLAMVSNPGKTAVHYADLAGYEGKGVGQRVTACRLLQNQAVIDAINECAGMRLRSAALVATDVLIKICADKRTRAGDRLRAAEALLDRVGLAPMQHIQVDHNHSDRTGAAMMERIRELAQKHGMDAEMLLSGQRPEPRLAVSAQPMTIEGQVVDEAEAGRDLAAGRVAGEAR